AITYRYKPVANTRQWHVCRWTVPRAPCRTCSPGVSAQPFERRARASGSIRAAMQIEARVGLADGRPVRRTDRLAVADSRPTPVGWRISVCYRFFFMTGVAVAPLICVREHSHVDAAHCVPRRRRSCCGVTHRVGNTDGGADGGADRA